MAKKDPTKIDYNQLSQELTELLEQLELGELDIDTAVQRYERGLQIVSLLEERLQKAENRVTKLKAVAISASQEGS